MKVKGFTPEFRVGSISHEPFRWFSLNFTQIFLSVRWCAEPMTRLHRLTVKVTLHFHVIFFSIRVCSISPKPFEQFSSNFTKMFLLERWHAEHMAQLPRPKVKVRGFTLEFCICSISTEPFWRFSLNFTQMFLLVRRCAEHMTQLPRLKVTGHGRGIYP